MQLEALIGPVLESMGLEFVDATFRREGSRRVLRVTVDREGGVDLDTIAAASQRVSRRLDLEDFAKASYTLEVSSPGVERPLKRPADYVKRVGERVRVKTYEPVDGARTHAGVIAAAGPDRVTIATEAGERKLRYEDISSARTVFEWGPGSKK